MRREHYLGGALTDEESKEFLATYNKKDERVCIGACGKKFISEGSHNRKCPTCKSKESYQSDKTMSRDIPVHKYSAAFKRMNAFRGEID